MADAENLKQVSAVNHEPATSAQDIAAFTEDVGRRGPAPPALTSAERNHAVLPQPLVKIVNHHTGDETQANLADLNRQTSEFHRVILLIEDDVSDSDDCAAVLHRLGYDGVRVIDGLAAAEQHLDDMVAGLTEPPDAIVLDLGLGFDSGFTILRKCHAEPMLQQVPILVWTKHTDQLSETFSTYLGASDFLVKSCDEAELAAALQRLLLPRAA